MASNSNVCEAESGIEEEKQMVPSLIHKILEGRDILTRIKNETRRSEAYCMSCLQKINTDSPFIQALMLVPTNELAVQTSQICGKLNNHEKIKIMFTTGGTDLREDLLRLNGVVHLIIATPARILDLMDEGVAKVDNCKILALDESDELLSKSLLSVEGVLEYLPTNCQFVVCFSKFTPDVVHFALDVMREPLEIGLSEFETIAEARLVTDYLRNAKEQLVLNLMELRRHCVYAFFTKEKFMLYSGQTKNYAHRIHRHFKEAYNRENKQSFYRMLIDELKNGGVYVLKIFDGLTSLEADELEYMLIQIIKRSGLSGNVADGHLTDRFSKLSLDEKEGQVTRRFAEAMSKIQEVPETEMFTEQNVKTLLESEEFNIGRCKCGNKITNGGNKCGLCYFIVVANGKCEREGCPNGYKGLGKDGYCWSCYSRYGEDIKNGRTIPAFDASKSHSRAGRNFDNHVQRSLVYSIKDKMPSWGGTNISTCISNILGRVVITQPTIDPWRRQIDGKNGPFVLSTFLKGNMTGEYDGLSSASVKALIVYENSREQTIEQATQRLKRLFPDDENKFTDESVKDIYDNVQKVKDELKILFKKEELMEPDAKKPKIKE